MTTSPNVRAEPMVLPWNPVDGAITTVRVSAGLHDRI